ncbi:putative membrane protein [Promicromonospora umidemergens]|uniref:YdbS-like PH domain-containing protein n=1 Tax=Promicromonospora umidemergens TaxID=629679 RepID=A0ABP8WRX9_9MICO|nr:PH domain-containing protein [Promicromonospora umidemergens]MCP2283471.1 putative membrane protein [Promicromonospora umidemergens]
MSPVSRAGARAGARPGARAPAALLAAELVHTLPSFALLVVAVSAWSGRGDGQMRTAGLVVVLVAFALRLVGPVYGWLSVTYVVDDSGVAVTSGLVARRTRAMAWSRVRSVETRRPWHLRLFRLNRVTLIQAGEESAQVVLGAVPDGDPLLSRLLTFAGPGSDAGVPAEPGGPALDGAAAEASELDQETLIHALDRRGLVLVSLAHGQAFLLAPVVLMTAWEAIDTLGLAEGLNGATERFGIVWVGVVAALGAMVVGVVGTLVRFHEFRVTVLRDGRLAIRYGLIEARERVVDPGAVVGVMVQRNILERLMGRARLSVVTRDASGGLGTNLIVPSVSLVVVDALVRRHLSSFMTERTYRAEGRGALVRSSVSTLGLVAVPVLVLGLTQVVSATPVVWSAVAALVSFALLRGVGALLTAELHVDPVADVVVHTTLFAVERITTVAASSLHGVAAWQRPGRRAGPPMLVTCHLYTGRARRLAAVRCDRQDLDVLRAALVAGSGDMAMTSVARGGGRPG